MTCQPSSAVRAVAGARLLEGVRRDKLEALLFDDEELPVRRDPVAKA